MKEMQRTQTLSYQLDGLGLEPRRAQENFFRLHNRPHRLWGPQSFLFTRYHGSFPGVNWPGCDVGHCRLTNAGV